MDLNDHIKLILANEVKGKEPYTFRVITCSNFPKPFSEPSSENNSDNKYRYNFYQMVDVTIQDLPNNPVYDPTNTIKETKMPLKDYLLIGLRWKVYDEIELTTKESALLKFLEKEFQTTSSSEAEGISIDIETSEPGASFIEYDYYEDDYSAIKNSFKKTSSWFTNPKNIL